MDLVTVEKLSQKQEAELSFYLEQDPDIWLVLLDQFIESQGTNSRNLIQEIVNDTPEWQKTVLEVKKKGFGSLKNMALEKPIQWNIRLRQLLSDPIQVPVFKFYLKAVIALKMKKINDFGGRGATKQKINAILSFGANEAYTYLDRYWELTSCLEKGKTPSGVDMTPALKIYYTSRQNDHLKRVILFLAFIVIFKGAGNLEDTHRLQEFIELNLIAPLSTSLAASTEKYEQNQIKEKLEIYKKVRSAVEITFE